MKKLFGRLLEKSGKINTKGDIVSKTMITNYANVSDLIVDIEGGETGIWTDKGLVKSVLVAASPTTKIGFVQLFIKNFSKLNSIGADERFAYSLAQFQLLNFIKDLEGLSLYLNTVPYVGTQAGAVADVGNTGDTLSAAFGDYSGSVAGTYTIEVTTPGALDGSTSEVTITGPTNDAGPFTVNPNSGVAFNVGNFGVQLRLTAGVSGVLTAGDIWTINVATAITTISSWDALTQPQRDQYIADAEVLIEKNMFVPNYPTTAQLV